MPTTDSSSATRAKPATRIESDSRLIERAPDEVVDRRDVRERQRRIEVVHRPPQRGSTVAGSVVVRTTR